MYPKPPRAPPTLVNIPVRPVPILADLLYVRLWREHAVCAQLPFARQPAGPSNNSQKHKTNEKCPASTLTADGFQERDALNGRRMSTCSGGFPGKWVCLFRCLLHHNMQDNLQFVVL